MPSPSSYLLSPVTGEIFTSIEACEQRLRGFALAEGFDIAHTEGGNKRISDGRWQCGYHGKETRTWRKGYLSTSLHFYLGGRHAATAEVARQAAEESAEKSSKG